MGYEQYLYGRNKKGDIASGDYTEFEADGTITMKGDATVWDDQQVNISSVRLPPSGAPSWAAYKGGQVLEFSGSADNTIYFTAQLSHKIKVGSDIDFHIHYVPEDNTAGNARWVFTYSWANISEAMPGETTVTKILATPEVTDKHTYADIADISPSATQGGISSILLCSLTRTGSHGDDTYNNKVIRLTAADFHLEMDMIGSRTELAKLWDMKTIFMEHQQLMRVLVQL